MVLSRSLEMVFESVWSEKLEIGWHEDASYLYYSAGWLIESEQAGMLSLHKSSRGDQLGEQPQGMREVNVRGGQ